MAKLRGDLLVIKFEEHSSGVAAAVISGTTSWSFDSSSEALETTDSDDGLNAAFMQGKVTRTISGDYMVATDLENWKGLDAKQAAAENVSWEIFNKTTGSEVSVMSGTGVITTLNLSGGTAADLTTGSWAMNVTGPVSTE